MPKIMTLPEWTTPGFSHVTRKERKDVPVATTEELLRFAQRFREAGGGDALPALLPSEPNESNACLIANAMNFHCEVDGMDENTDEWQITITDISLTDKQVEAMSEIVGSQPFMRDVDDFSENPPEEGAEKFYWELKWALPPHIGNAADAFDRGVAFQEFVL